MISQFLHLYSKKQDWWIKTSLTFKCLIEHLLADFSYPRPLDTYLWKQMMKMNRNITYKWCNIAKKHLLFTKRKCHKFSWLFTASRCSPRRKLICACRIACKVLVSIGLKSLSFSFLKKGFFLGKPYPEIRWPSPVPFYKHGFQRRKPFRLIFYRFHSWISYINYLFCIQEC